MTRKAVLPPLTQAEVVRRVAREVELMGSRVLAARTWQISPQLLSLILRGTRTVGPKLCKALHLKRMRVTVYRYQPDDAES